MRRPLVFDDLRLAQVAIQSAILSEYGRRYVRVERVPRASIADTGVYLDSVPVLGEKVKCMQR